MTTKNKLRLGAILLFMTFMGNASVYGATASDETEPQPQMSVMNLALEVAALKNGLADEKQKRSDLSAQVQAQQQEIASLKSQLQAANLAATLAKVQSDLQRLETTLTGQTSSISSVQGRVDSEARELKRVVEALKVTEMRVVYLGSLRGGSGVTFAHDLGQCGWTTQKALMRTIIDDIPGRQCPCHCKWNTVLAVSAWPGL